MKTNNWYLIYTQYKLQLYIQYIIQYIHNIQYNYINHKTTITFFNIHYLIEPRH
jgi:hypothetical protein